MRRVSPVVQSLLFSIVWRAWENEKLQIFYSSLFHFKNCIGNNNIIQNYLYRERETDDKCNLFDKYHRQHSKYERLLFSHKYAVVYRNMCRIFVINLIAPASSFPLSLFSVIFEWLFLLLSHFSISLFSIALHHIICLWIFQIFVDVLKDVLVARQKALLDPKSVSERERLKKILIHLFFNSTIKIIYILVQTDFNHKTHK